MRQAEVLVEPPATAPLPRPRPAVIAAVADAPVEDAAAEAQGRDPIVIQGD
jgi:hypothetical protein